MIVFDTSPQGSDAWLDARRGCVTGSRCEDARSKLKEWTLSRLLATRPAAEPVVFNADTQIGDALRVRCCVCCCAGAAPARRAQRASSELLGSVMPRLWRPRVLTARNARAAHVGCGYP